MKQYISYTSKDFNSIKTDLINAISSLTNIWTSREQSDPGMVIVTLIAALGDMLSFNMDKQSLEFFGKTVTQRKNAQAIFDLLGYKMHWYEGAKLKLTIHNVSNEPINLLFNPTNNANTQKLSSTLVASAPNYFILNPNETAYNWNNNTVISLAPNNQMEFNAVQGNLHSLTFTSAAIDKNNRYYLPVTKIDQNNMWLLDETNSYNWYLTDSIAKLDDTLPRFEFNVDEYNMPYIEFVPYWKSSFAHNKVTKFTLYYLATYGASGSVSSNILNRINNISTNNPSLSVTVASNSLVIRHTSNVYVNSEVENFPGRNPETAAEAYHETRKIVGTYNTLVTVVDFEKFYKRMGYNGYGFSNALVVDGQRAKDLNASVENSKNFINNFNCGVKNCNSTSGINLSDVIYVDYLLDAGDAVNSQENVKVVNSISKFDDISITYVLCNVDDEITDGKSGVYVYNENSKKYTLINQTYVYVTPYYSLSKSFESYNSGIYVVECNNNRLSWTKIDTAEGRMDAFGFRPYEANAYITFGDMLETDPLNSSEEYGYSEEVKVDSDNGYMLYTLSDKIIGDQSNSVVKSTKVDGLTLDECKLISANMIYAGIRKFPFYIDGQIHLREPMSPANANLVLQNVYKSLRASLSASNLTFGKKINFADVIRIINNADDNIDYFDAGANNSSGSLFVYPKVGDIDAIHSTNLAIEKYGINIDPQYFNPISLQHYEDFWYQNSSYLYWFSTASGHLSIAPDSIKNKTTPYLRNSSFSVYESSENFEVKFAKEYGEDAAVHHIVNLLEYANVSEIKIQLYKDNNGYILPNVEGYVDLDAIYGEPILGSWQNSNIFSNTSTTSIKYVNAESGTEIDSKDLEGMPSIANIFAVRMKSTPTTNASTVAYTQNIAPLDAETE